MPKLDSRELGTVLAALRVYQRSLENGGLPPAEVMDIATDGGTEDPLEVDEIDGLCEKLNVEEDDQSLTQRVTEFIADLDALGLAEEDASVSCVATSDVVRRHLAALRESIDG